MANILLIDDDKSVGEMLCISLRMAEHKVKYVMDGNTALSMLEEGQPDLIITDIIMPHINGITLIKKVKELYPTIKLIAISGGGRTGADDFLETAEMYGADAVIKKPFERNDILQKISQLCG